MRIPLAVGLLLALALPIAAEEGTLSPRSGI